MKKIINWLNCWQCGTKWCIRRYLLLSLFMFWIGLFFFLMSLCCHASTESDINTERVNKGLQPLSVSLQMMCSSFIKVDDMVKNDYFSHISPLGVEVGDIFDKMVLDYSIAGEILAQGYEGQELIDAWMESPTHRAIILDSDFNKVGCFSNYGKTACHFYLK